MTPYERTKAWRAANPGTRAAEGKKWRSAHPGTYQEIRSRYKQAHREEILERDRQAKRTERATDPEAQRRRNRAYQERLQVKKVAMAGRPKPEACEICEEPGKVLFDHCHQTGVFRGWICDRCNKTLGHVKDSPTILRKLAVYLENHNGEVNNEGSEEDP